MPGRRAVIAGGLAAALLGSRRTDAATLTLGGERVALERIAERLEDPVALGFLPRGGVLVAERAGNLAEIRPGRRIQRYSGVPRVPRIRGAGLRDILVPRDVARSRRILLSYVDDFAFTQMRLVLARAAIDLNSGRLTGIERIWEEDPPADGTGRMSGRLCDAGDGSVYLALGDRGTREAALDPTLAVGKIYRLGMSGGVALNAPILGDDARRGIWSMGHADPAALAVRPADGSLWCLDGDGTADWLTRVLAGLGHAAPGEAESGARLGEDPENVPVMRPAHVWNDPVRGTALAFLPAGFGALAGSALLGTRRGLRLVRLKGDRLSGDVPAGDDLGRIADIRIGPDGAAWILAGGGEGTLWRLGPA